MPIENPATLLLAAASGNRRRELCRTLEQAGFRVFEAENGREVLDLVSKLWRTPPDLILLDVELPEIDGFEVCRQLKSRPESDRIPIVQISGDHPDSAGVIQCFESGADDCLSHPLRDGELLARVRARIRHQREEARRTTHLLALHSNVLRATLARLKAAVEVAELGVWECTGQLKVWEHGPVSTSVRLDKTCREMFGLTDRRPISMEEMLALVHPDDRAKVGDQIRANLGLYGSGIFDAECRILRADGTERWVAMRAHEIRPRVPLSRLLEVVGTLIDITERKRSEELLVRSEKVAALGRMAATLAHEINNPLDAVMSTLFLARSSKECPESLRHYLELADEQVNYICHITRRALGFYREGSAPAAVSISAVLDETLWLFKSKLNAKHVAVEKTVSEGEFNVLGRSGEVRQVFSNLVANSLDATHENGIIKIRVSRYTAARDGAAYVRITVADNGKGIEPSARPHLFEPLFTTKGVSGTGLGLWVSKQLVEEHGGSIRVRSSTDTRHSGTTISVLLPAAPAETPLANSKPPQPLNLEDDEAGDRVTGT